jgi:hypothetical protein
MLLAANGSKNDKVRAVIATCAADVAAKAAARSCADDAEEGEEPSAASSPSGGKENLGTGSFGCAVLDANGEAMLRCAAAWSNDRQPGAREGGRRLLALLKKQFRVRRGEEKDGTTGDLAWDGLAERTLGKAEAVRIARIA